MTVEDPIDLRAALPTGALLPGDAGYDAACISFNGMLQRTPAAVISCGSVADVASAVRGARAAGLPIAIRGGGHSVAGHSLPDGAIVVSLDRMRDIEVDPERRLAHAGGGALWDDIDAAAFAHGLALTGGTFGDTGIGGLTLGGGIGWLMPIAGLTCDNLVAAEVVTANGSVATAGPGGDEELLWALRGGGGNFGIVTRFTYRLTPVGPMAGGRIRYRSDAAGAVFDRVRELVERWPTASLPTFGLHRGVDGGGSEITFLLGIVDGSDAEPIFELLRRDLPVTLDELGPRTYLELQALAGTLPFGLRHYWKGHFLRELDRDLFVELVAAADAADSVSDGLILLEGLTGAGLREPAGGAAFGQRGARWNASALAIWESPDDDATAVSWARRVAAILEPHSFSGGGYMNYSPVDESAERVRAAYGSDRWERLVAVKRRLDPENAFRFNHNIPPG